MNIHQAIKSGKIQSVAAVIDADLESIDELDEVGRSPLFTAVLHRNQAAVDLLLEHDANCDIFACAYLNRDEYAAGLLRRDPFLVNAKTNDGKTALHYAAQSGNIEIAKVLIDNDADVNAVDNNGNTPLNAACHTGPWKSLPAVKVIHLLLSRGAKIDLHNAAAMGRTDLANEILDQDPAVIDELNHGDKTALYLAAQNNQLEMVHLLVERGADVNRGDSVGIAALHRTSQQCRDELIRYLIAHGAEAHLCCYVACGDTEGTRQALAKNAHSANELFYEYNAVGYAIHSWQLGTLRVLLQHGCTLTETDQQHILRISGNDQTLLGELMALTPNS